MINRNNWLMENAFLAYRADIDQLSSGSLKFEKRCLIHLLEWADDVPFANSSKISPTYPRYLLTVRRDSEDGQLSRSYVNKLLSTARRFLRWLKLHRRGFGSLSEAWIESLKPVRMPDTPKDRESISLAQIRAIAEAPVNNLREERIRAAAVFWYLSGIRIGAFVTLPICAVDLNEFSVKQWPSLGVKTKFGKHATTYLLQIPELLSVVKQWDDLIRSELSESSMWFAPLCPVTGEIASIDMEVGNYRDAGARKDLKRWMDRIGVPYLSPHKYRHGFAEYGSYFANGWGEYKAVSQNLMHEDIGTTDRIYGILSDDKVKDQIMGLGISKRSNQDISSEKLNRLLDMKELIEQIIDDINTG